MNTTQLINSLLRSAYRRYGYTQLEVIRARLERGVVVLEGQLPTEHLKQVAETIAMSVPQISRVENRIAVCDAQQLASANCDSSD